jgi:hypothetical protein
VIAAAQAAGAVRVQGLIRPPRDAQSVSHSVACGASAAVSCAMRAWIWAGDMRARRWRCGQQISSRNS